LDVLGIQLGRNFLRILEHGCRALFSTVLPYEVQSSPSGRIELMKQALEVVMKELHSPGKSRAIPATPFVGWIIESGTNVTDVIFPTINTSVGTLLHLWKGTATEPGRTFC